MPSSYTVVVAPDSLKGTCSAPDAARAIARGVRTALGDAARIIELPLADGGEGSLEALVAAWGGRVATVPTTDALGRPREGRVGFGDPALLGIIEAADANGLPAVSDQPLRPLDADSAGVGRLIAAALDEGVAEILLCLGGSATSDGGAGMLGALGVRFLDEFEQDLAPGARGLGSLRKIDLSGLHPRARRVRWRIACDVENPLLGPRGAAAVFAPQKGAGIAEVAEIDAGLTRWATVLADAAGVSFDRMVNTPGIGAAGGLGLGPLALFGAELVPGAQLIAEAAGLPDAIGGAYLIITAEGRLDEQSLDGKVVSQVLSLADGVPVAVLAGSVALSKTELDRAGIAAALPLIDRPSTGRPARDPETRDDLVRETPARLAGAAERACRVLFRI